MRGSIFKAILAGDPAVTAKLGDRLYRNRAPAKVKEPYAVFHRMPDELHMYNKSGKSWSEVTWQVHVIDDDPEEMDAIAELIDDRLDLFAGVVNGITIQESRLTDTAPGDLYDEQARRFLVGREYTMRYRR